MVKGIYNEHEFYTFNYWDSKLKEEVKSNNKKNESLDQNINALKDLSQLHWDLKGLDNDDPNYEGLLVDFNTKILESLGFEASPSDFLTQEEQNITAFTNIKSENDQTSLLAFYVRGDEEGDFSQQAFSLTEDGGEEADQRELNEILNEDLSVESGPKWVLVLAPNALFLIERSKWAYGRYLKADWDEVFSQNDKEVFELLIGLFSKEVLAPSSGASLHDNLDDESHRHAYAVTTELREGVRESIEILVNEIIAQKKKSHEKFLADNPEAYAKELTHDALFYVYRLIFLLFLEAQGEDSDLLPLKSQIYRGGYSLDKLLETTFLEVQEGSAEYEGKFLHQSLEKIFQLIFNGFEPERFEDLIDKNKPSSSGFLVKGLKSDLFDPTKLHHLGTVELRNGELQKILIRLSLSKPKDKKSKSGRISYANLGINQLGAVYEGLLSYSGFFASEDLYALKPEKVKQSDIEKNKELDKIYLAPQSIVDEFCSPEVDEKYQLVKSRIETDERGKETFVEGNFLLDESGNEKIFKKGSFVYRLAGRDRKLSASYYTPESLTKCTVKYSLKALFEKKKTLDELWGVKILEPAMGSGAFLNEVVNQLAEKIIHLELEYANGAPLAPKEKKRRINEIKYKLITNNVYGVDLNITAVELAKFSLWLNCIGINQPPPDFKGRLKIGNSLLGGWFRKNVDGFFPCIQPSLLWGDIGDRIGQYSIDEKAALHNFRNKLSDSRDDVNETEIKRLQEKIELLLLKARKEMCLESREKLSYILDLWCAGFFIGSKDLRAYPDTWTRYLEVVENIIDNPNKTNEVLTLLGQMKEKHNFFHWELEFLEVFNEGGFDLVIGNPPWISIGWEDSLYVSDYNVLPAVRCLNASDTREFVTDKESQSTKIGLCEQFIQVDGFVRFLESPSYQILKGVSKNTYKAFAKLGFDVLVEDGVMGQIFEDGIIEDKKASLMRRQFYHKYRYHFQFQNEKFLFEEVGHAKRFSVNIFNNSSVSDVDFSHIGNLFIPSTIDSCFELSKDEISHDIPLIKDDQGNWEVTGHPQRVVSIDSGVLESFGFFQNNEFDVPLFLNLHSKPLLNFVKKIGICENTFDDYIGRDQSVGSRMFDETGAQNRGQITRNNGIPDSIDQVILSGPHISTYNPCSQQTEQVYRSKFSYETPNLESLSDDFFPRTLYKTDLSEAELNGLFPRLDGQPYRSFYRVITRRMINPTNERCMFTCIIPPGAMHIGTMDSLAISNPKGLLLLAGITGSLVFDAIQRLQSKSDFFNSDFRRGPLGSNTQYFDSINRRALALNGLTKYYSSLWEKSAFLAKEDGLMTGRNLRGYGEAYSFENPLRGGVDRVQSQTEIDALTALVYGLTVQELLQVYENLFPVLRKNDLKNGYNRKDNLKLAYDFFEKRGW